MEQNLRIQRALSERLYLLNYDIITTNHVEFLVEGSKGSNYKIIFTNKITCECLDYNLRKKICKHIYFIVGKILKDDDLFGLLKKNNNPSVNVFKSFNIISKLDNIFKNNEIKNENVIVDKNDDCVICFDEFGNEQLFKCLICNNHFHLKCLEIWINKHNSCPLCRSSIDITNVNNKHNGLEKLNTLSILNALNTITEE